MKKLIVILMCMVLTIGARAQFPGSGTGTKTDPYLILNSDQLYSVRNFLDNSNVYFSILNDIDISDYAYGSGWEPIGSNSSSSAFKGNIDGNGHKITGLEINKPTKDYVGLFGNTYYATIKNVTVEGNITGRDYVGGIAGFDSGSSSLENVHFKGTIHGNNVVGGIINEGTINNCSFSGTIIGKDYVGGITGYTARVSRCYVDAKISANKYVGGIAGYNVNNSIKDCSVYVSISATDGYVGGIAGKDVYSALRCSVNGDISAHGNYVGGIAGNGGDCYNSYFMGYLHGYDYVGGITGGSGSSCRNCYVKGIIMGHNNVGGISVYSPESSVCISSLIESETTKVGRIIPSGTSSKCYSLYTTKILAAGFPISEDEINNNISVHGTNILEKNLKMSTFYQGLGWDFSSTWNIIDTECLPYLQTQTAPPVIQSSLACGETTISGNSVDGGTVKVIVDGKEYTAATVNNKWSVTVPALQAGAKVIARASVEGLFPSYNVEKYVSYQGNGTEDDPYLVNTCSDLMNIHGDGYYKLTSDIDLSEAAENWQPLGMYNEAITHLDGDNHTISNLQISQDDILCGLFAYLIDATVKNLTIETAPGMYVQGTDYVGVLAGRLVNCTIENVTIKGNVKGNTEVGGLAGQIHGGTLENVRIVSSSITGKNLVGGIAGTSSATINLCKFEGDVTDNVVANDGIKSGTIVYVGGIAAKSEGTITQTYSAGSVTATRVGSKAGGLVGDNYAAITNSYSTADVNGDTYAAGIAADNHAKVEKCYAAGNITATNSSAKTFSSGIVGYNDGETAVVSQCAAMNKYVISTSDVGNVFRVIGGIKNSAPIPGNTNYAMENMILSVNGIRKIQGDDVFNGYMRADEMFKTQSLFENNGWDFSDVWEIVEEESYPTLLQMNTAPITPDYTAGDANGDGNITMSDVVSIISHIMGTTLDGFNAVAADINGDTKVTLSDVVLLIDKLMGKTSAQAAPRRTNVFLEAGELYAANYNAELLTLGLSNATSMTAVQMDIVLPEGIEVEEVTVSSKHVATWEKLDSGKTRLIIYSPSNRNFNGNNFATIHFTGNAAEKGITIEDISECAANGKEFSLADLELGSATAIRNVSNEDAPMNIVTISGQSLGKRDVRSLTPGVYVINGKKHIIK